LWNENEQGYLNVILLERQQFSHEQIGVGDALRLHALNRSNSIQSMQVPQPPKRLKS
jgi:hypothetical protein